MSYLSRLALPLITLTTLAACGSTSGNASSFNGGDAGASATQSGVQSDNTSPASPMQSSLAASSDGLTGADEADSGSLTAPDGTASGKSALAVGRELLASCVATVTNPSPLDPNALPTSYTITWTYTNCGRTLRGGTVSGTRELNVTRDGNQRTATNSIALNRSYFDGTDLTSDGNVTLVATGTRAAGEVISRAITGDGNRIFTKVSGKEEFNHTYSLALQSADTLGASAGDANQLVVTGRVLNGTVTLHHNLVHATTVSTFTSLAFAPQTCAWPTGGSLAVVTTFKDNSTSNKTFAWSLPCGTVSVDGAANETLTDAP